jgi:hypothetical protein
MNCHFIQLVLHSFSQLILFRPFWFLTDDDEEEEEEEEEEEASEEGEEEVR